MRSSWCRHAVLGAGGIGGLLAGALGRSGAEVVLLLRRESLAAYPGRLRAESVVLGDFERVDMAGAEAMQEALRAAGIECHDHSDERSLLWGKLVVLAPIALATTAVAAPFGAVRTDKRFVGCREEAIAVARAEGATVDAAATRVFHDQVPADMRSSMQKDVAAGHQPELDAIAGPIIRGGARHAIPTPNTASLAAEIGAYTSSH